MLQSHLGTLAMPERGMLAVLEQDPLDMPEWSTAAVPEQGTLAMPEQGHAGSARVGHTSNAGARYTNAGGAGAGYNSSDRGSTLAVLDQDLPMCHCSLWQQVPGQDEMLLLAQGFVMRRHTIPPAETIPA